MAKIISSRKKYVQVNDLHSKSSFSFPIPEGFSHTNGYIKFEIDVG